MRNAKKALLAAAAFVLIGALLFAGAMAALNFNFRALGTQNYKTQTMTIREPFAKVDVHTSATNICIVPSDDETCSIVCREAEQVRCAADVTDDTLTIRMIDSRKWYDYIGINIDGDAALTLKLPKKTYASLCAKTSAGEIRISDLNAVALRMSASDGQISLQRAELSGAIDVQAASGDILLTDTVCASFSGKSGSGNILLKQMTADGELFAESDTGNIQLDDCDAANLHLTAKTGNVTGTLLSKKTFAAESKTGGVDVPKTNAGGRCEIKTETGDIRMRVR